MITDLVYHVSLCFHVSSSCSAPRPRMAAALRALSSRRAAWLCFAPGFAHQEYLHTGADIKGCVALSPQSCAQLIRIGGRLRPPGPQGHPGNPEAALSRWWTGVRGSDLKPSGGFQQGGAPVAQRAGPTPSLPGLTSLPLTISWLPNTLFAFLAWGLFLGQPRGDSRESFSLGIPPPQRWAGGRGEPGLPCSEESLCWGSAGSHLLLRRLCGQ